MPEDLIYKVTKLMNEHAKDFHGLFPGSEEIQTKTALDYNKLPIHPGAERYYREIGLLALTTDRDREPSRSSAEPIERQEEELRRPMRFLWFHLMPYPDFPEDFKQKHNSVWVDIDPKLFDPVRAHEIYNEYMDEMEYAAECGFDAICVNEHHANGYGLMPSPNLIATALARRTSDAAICVLGSSLALYDPPTRVAEEFAMVDCISGGRLIAGLAGRHADGHLLRLRHEPEHAAPALSRGARPDQGMLAARRRVLVQRPLQPAALRQHVAAPDAEAVSADLDSRRRLGGDLELVRRQRIRLLLHVVLRLRLGRRDDAELLERDGGARQGPQPVPRRLPPVRRRRREHGRRRSGSTRSRPSISTTAACTSIRATRRRPATSARRRSA